MIEIKIQFQDLSELEAWLTKHSERPLKEVSAPAKKKAAPKKKAVKEETPVVQDAVEEDVETVEIDVATLREELKTQMIAKNEAFNDGNVKIMAFIKSFGVNRLSELPDDKLSDFATALNELS